MAHGSGRARGHPLAALLRRVSIFAPRLAVRRGQGMEPSQPVDRRASRRDLRFHPRPGYYGNPGGGPHRGFRGPMADAALAVSAVCAPPSVPGGVRRGVPSPRRIARDPLVVFRGCLSARLRERRAGNR